MSETNRKFFSGRSLDQAVVAAANHYGIHPEEVKYREIEKRHGFVRTRRNAVIVVDPEDVQKSPGERAAERTRPRRDEGRAEAAAETESGRGAAGPGAAREARAPRERDETPVEPRVEERLEEGRPGAEAREERGRGRGERKGRRRERAPREPRAGRGAEAAPAGEREEGPRRGKPTTSGPWWQAEPVTEETEEMEDGVGPEAESQEPEESEEAGEGERYRFVESSEGLKRRERPGAPVKARPRGRRGGRRGRDGQAAKGGVEDPVEGGGQRRRGGRRGGGRSRREAAPPAPVAAPPLTRLPPRAERLPQAEEELAEAAQDALDRLLEFAGVEAEAEFFRNDERLEVELWGPDDHVLLEDDGQLLLAIEHLLPRMLRSLYGDSMPVRVDCDDFHARREERLRAVALEAADEVRRSGKPRTLDELDPAERRIVHLSLADAEDVRTESFGSGYYKRVKILPS